MVGSGPNPVIVCHGWMGDHRLFDPLIEEIDRTRFTYAFFDCRGYGTRLAEAGPMTVEAMARDVILIADYLSWNRFNIIGHSMGGMAAQRLMVDVPGRLISAVLIAPVSASGAKIDEGRRNLLLHAIHEPAVRRDLIDANTGRKQNAAWLQNLLELSLRSTCAEALAIYMQAWTSTDFASDARGAAVPALVIVGEFDPSTSIDRVRETILTWYTRAQAIEMKGVGHYPMLEDPRELARLIESYLSSTI
jgi:pimeloyl-ACP methyl ester carboxylesterase